jgi:hypothetical protein
MSSVGFRVVTNGAPLAAGTVVYRVVELDHPPDVDSPHTWKAAAVIVERASAKQIKLRSAFPGLTRTVFDPSAFGRDFFASPLEAIKMFLIARRMELDTIERRRKDVERAIAWALYQPGMEP